MLNMMRSKVAAIAAAVSLGVALAACSEMLSREDFAARVKDKSDTEVKKAVGTPAASRRDPAGPGYLDLQLADVQHRREQQVRFESCRRVFQGGLGREVKSGGR